MNHDSITLSRLRFFGHHGALPVEKERGQFLEVTVKLEAPFAEAARTDDITQALDYRAVYAAVRAVMEGPRRQLAETLADHVAAELLRAFPTVLAVEVEITKSQPPVDFVFAGFTARVRRTRPGA